MTKPEELSSQPPAPKVISLTLIGPMNTYNDAYDLEGPLDDNDMTVMIADLVRTAWKTGEAPKDCIIVIQFKE